MTNTLSHDYPGFKLPIHAMRWDGCTPVLPHDHDFVEIAFLAQGSCLHVWHGAEVRLVPGDVLIIAPLEAHAYQIECQTVIWNCLFYPSALGDDWVRLQEDTALQDLLVLEPLYRPVSGKQAILHFGRQDADQLESLWLNMIQEEQAAADGCEVALKSLLVLLLIRLSRAWRHQYANLAGLYDQRRSLLAETLAYIDQHAGEPLSPAELASQHYISPGHFRRLFREATGLTPVDYVNKLRISLAQKLLLDTSRSIAEVAAAVGIGDPNYFTRLFKSLVGCTPSEFRLRSSGTPAE